MKIQIGTVIVCVALLLTMFAPVSSAQSRALRFEIPFAFYVGSTLLPAGTYYVNSAKQLAIRIYDGERHSALALTHAQRNDKSNDRLVFNQYGTLYFLSASYWEGFTGQELTPSNQELEVASKAATAARVALVPTR